jgi:hypothetical protein
MAFRSLEPDLTVKIKHVPLSGLEVVDSSTSIRSSSPTFRRLAVSVSLALPFWLSPSTGNSSYWLVDARLAVVAEIFLFVSVGCVGGRPTM